MSAYETTCCEHGCTEAPRSSGRRVPQVVGAGLLAMVAIAVLAGAVLERAGLAGQLTRMIPWPVVIAVLVWGGWPVLRNVARATLQRRVTAHTLMTVGMLGALAIGEYPAAAVIVFFMRFAAWLERTTTERSHRAVAELVSMAPETARVVREGLDIEVPVEQVRIGDVVAVRPGERIPVDGVVRAGDAAVDQSAITGESLPVDATAGSGVYAATVLRSGWLELQATRVGGDSTFGRIVRLVEEAQNHKTPVQRFADRFSAWYLPFVLIVAAATFVIGGSASAAVAVLVVSCSCAIAMATPVAVVAAVGRGARRGLLVKSGVVLERLAKIDTVVLDKTGTLTWGRPKVTKVVAFDGLAPEQAIAIAASLEARSEHPLARAVVHAAAERGVTLPAAGAFEPLPGRGVRGRVDGADWVIGSARLLAQEGIDVPGRHEGAVLYLASAGRVAAMIEVADELREEAAAVIADLRALGVRRTVLLTGDVHGVAGPVADALGLECRCEQLPSDKIEVVKQLQAEGHVVLMVGDGVNDAPALAQADVGLAMGAAGAHVAIETADAAIMLDDLRLIPSLVRLGRRTSRTIRQNLGFTAVYNTAGIVLAAAGILPPIWAAAAQVGPDVMIMGNSSRLLWWRDRTAPHA